MGLSLREECNLGRFFKVLPSFSSSLGKTIHSRQNRACILLRLLIRCQIWPCAGQSHKRFFPVTPAGQWFSAMSHVHPNTSFNCADSAIYGTIPFQKLSFLHFCWIYSLLNFCFSFYLLIIFYLFFLMRTMDVILYYHYNFAQKGRNVFPSLYCGKPT